MKLEIPEIKIKDKLLIKQQFITINNGITVISGNNGSGKTLLLKYAFSSNKSISKSYVDQDSNLLIPTRSVSENILLSKNKHKINTLTNLLKGLDLEYLLLRKPKHLSGGEKRLVVLIRGLLTNFKVIFLDEPTNDLDNKYISLVINIINFFAKTKKIVVSSHDKRIISLANTLYEIKDANLLQVTNFNKSNRKNDNFLFFPSFLPDKSYVFNLIKNNYFFIFISLFLMLILIPSIKTIIRENIIKEDTNILPDNQINLYTLKTTRSNHIENIMYTVPVTSAKNITKNDPFKTLIDYKKNQNKIDLIKHATITYLKQSDMFDFYPTYFLIDNEVINVLTTFLSNQGFNPEVTDLETSDYFVRDNYPHIVFTKSTYFDYDEFQSCINEIAKNKNAKVIGAILILKNNYSFSDFLNSDFFSSLDSNTIIYNNKIKYELQSINRLKLNFKYSLIMIFSAVLLIFINCFFTFILVFVDRKKILIFKNYNISEYQIIDEYKSKIASKHLSMVFLFCFLLINYILVMSHTLNFIMFFASISFFIYIIFSYILSQRLTESYIKYIFSWRYRFQ